MPLSAGAKLGPYEIVVPFIAGGIGEVYRATDTKLDSRALPLCGVSAGTEIAVRSTG